MQKLYYSISEISSMLNEEQHVLRYWEKEFYALDPRKNRAGNRVYSEKDLKIVKIIKKLIREEKLTIKSAKEKLNEIIEGKIEYCVETQDLTNKIIPRNTIFEEEIDHKKNDLNKQEVLAVLKDVLSFLKN